MSQTHLAFNRARLLSPSRFSILTIACFGLITTFALLLWQLPLRRHLTSSPTTFGQSRSSYQAQLHLLVPATSTNEDLCKLLLSIQVLGYPPPVLINYGDEEQDDPYVQHLAKVQGLLSYMRQLQQVPDHDKDLVLIVDGYDVWFQLPPNVLLKRYFSMNDAWTADAQATYGKAAIKQHDIRQTILFGPDKLCWPTWFDRPACWAVPEAPLDRFAFGPLTTLGFSDSNYNMPRWLNSGTIMGPIDDLVFLFNATLDRIHNHFSINSDQLYFADLWGEQEIARLKLRPGQLEAAWRRADLDRDFPTQDIASSDNATEYHLGLDYASTIFQTVAFYKDFLTWTALADYWTNDQIGHPSGRSSALIHELKHTRRPYEILDGAKDLQSLGWEDISLCYNTATQQVPVLIHFTGEKWLRQEWWHSVWFQSSGDALRKAAVSRQKPGGSLSKKMIDGKWWFAASPSGPGRDEKSSEWSSAAWSIKDSWSSWNDLCQVHEQTLYRPR